jgi:hypothetical protein
VDYDKLANGRLGEPSEAIRVRVEASFLGRLMREMQRHRLAVRAVREPTLHGTPLSSNADIGPTEMLRTWQEVSASRSPSWQRPFNTGREEQCKLRSSGSALGCPRGH